MARSGRPWAGTGAQPGEDPSAEELRALAEALSARYEAYSADSGGRIRVEDLLSAAAAVCGEACIAAAGELDPDSHDLAPGSAVLSDRVNAILCADARDWADTGSSVFGIIRTGALAHGYDGADFPAMDEPFRLLAAGIAGADPAGSWGRVPLSVGPDHRPRPQPLRQAFELRPSVRGLLARAGLTRSLWPVATAGALVVELARAHAAIEPGLAIRLVLETVNGMAKLAPMTPRRFAEAATGGGDGVSGGAIPRAG